MVNRLLSILIIATILIIISQGSNLTNAQIYSITPYNMKKYMECKYDPLYCALKRDWILLFYNSSNERQVQTLQYLIPGYIKQFNFAKETNKQVGNLYPPTALIDCYSCISLCNGVGQKDLPLAIYKDKEKRKNIRYRGYISLIGLISFIKSHDPTTSYLAELYQPQGKINKGQDFSKKQITQIINKIQQSFQRLNKQMQKTQHKNEIQVQSQNQIKILQISNYNKNQKIKQDQQKQKINQEIEQVQIKIKTETETENIYQLQNTDQTKNKKSDLDKFLGYVESCSEFVVNIFACIGLPRFILQIIGWITYIFFFIILGTICVIVNVIVNAP